MAASSKRRPPKTEKKYYTVAEANATLPLLQRILRDITALAHDMRERHRRLNRLQDSGTLSQAHQEEMQVMLAEFERAQAQMRDYEAELAKLQIELKDYFTGLVDFRSLRGGREVYLCWKLGEAEVAHWHELDSGFSGRQKLTPEAAPRL
jgi:hypothetical protein